MKNDPPSTRDSLYRSRDQIHSLGQNLRYRSMLSIILVSNISVLQQIIPPYNAAAGILTRVSIIFVSNISVLQQIIPPYNAAAGILTRVSIILVSNISVLKQIIPHYNAAAGILTRVTYAIQEFIMFLLYF